MDYKDLFIQNIHILRELMFFRREDISEISEEHFNKWLAEGFIINQYDDIYSLPEEHVELSQLTRYFLMQKYFENSYLSGCSALENYGVYLAGNRHHTVMTNKEVDKDYLIVKNKILFVYKPYVENYKDFVDNKLIEGLGNKAIGLKYTCYLNFASLELALVDLFSMDKYVMDAFDFDEHGLYGEKIDKMMNREKLLKIAESTKETFIIDSTKNFINWIDAGSPSFPTIG